MLLNDVRSPGSTARPSVRPRSPTAPAEVCGQTDHLAGDCQQSAQRSASGKRGSHGSVGYAAFSGWVNCVHLIGMSSDTELNLSRSLTAFASSSMDEFLGYGIWDTGATGTMAGLDGMPELLSYEKMHGQAGGVIVDLARNITLTFANSEQNESVSTCVLPRYFEGPDDEISSLGRSFAVFDRSSPILLGVDVARDHRHDEGHSLLEASGTVFADDEHANFTPRLGPTTNGSRRESPAAHRALVRTGRRRRRQCDSGCTVQGHSRVCSSGEKTDMHGHDSPPKRHEKCA